MKRLVAIVGPTGIGKSRLALRLAEKFHGEIVGADSRQVYRFMDIGTAKPTPQELGAVPHHLIDIIDPDEEFSLAQYLDLARKTIDDIFQRGNVPFLVGGTGLYIKALLEGFQPPGVSPDTHFRYNREKEAGEKNSDALYNELVAADPDAAAKIDRRNVRRAIRALEVHARAGKAFSRLGRKEPPAFSYLVIGLTTDRTALYRIVDRRVDEMFSQGFIREVENLQNRGYDPGLPSLSGIGYRQAGQFLRGEISLEEAKRKMKTETHRFIRHQYAWFRRDDSEIHWFDAERQPDAGIEKMLLEFLGVNRKV
ncbi:MAG: tRNA (adenosine(37)-N6)-dimethylallyltransferase MiaA [Chloroflexi bacterium RBG_13_57_8]|nr:MAG: tRNA (adenosine(37)-N6)-dimethylallyltransferase MiaA [Chloroflexi bacterium RBG_13_57_8]